MATTRHSTPRLTEHHSTIRDLCRRWRYAQAKLDADCIVTEEEDLDKLTSATEDQLRAIEEQILAAEPEGSNDASEILRVVLELTGEDSAVDHRDTALLRQALRALALARHDRQPAKPAEQAPEPLPDDPETPWFDLYGRWLKLNATWAELNQAESVPDEVSDRLLDEESDLALKMAAAQPRRRWEVVQKLAVLEKYMEQHNWSDRRDWLLLASLKRDVTEMS